MSRRKWAIWASRDVQGGPTGEPAGAGLRLVPPGRRERVMPAPQRLATNTASRRVLQYYTIHSVVLPGRWRIPPDSSVFLTWPHGSFTTNVAGKLRVPKRGA